MRAYRLAWIVIAAAAGAAAPVASRDRVPRTDAERLERALVGLVPDQAVNCIGTRDAGSSASFGDTLVYEPSRRLKYRNDTHGGCGGVGRDDILITVTPSTQLCRGDIVQTVDRQTHLPSGSCALGAFIPYRRP